MKSSEDVPPAAVRVGTCDWCCLAREVLGIQPCVRYRLDLRVAAMRAKDRKSHDVAGAYVFDHNGTVKQGIPR